MSSYGDRNSVGDVFHPGAYWKELDQDGPDKVDSIMNVEGVSFKAPTTTADDHASVFMDRPKKRNYKETFDRLSGPDTKRSRPSSVQALQ